MADIELQRLKNAMVLIRQARLRDIAAMSAMSAENYPKHYYEGEEALASKIAAYLRGCFVAEDDGEIVGYAISVPWIAGKIIELDSFYTIPAAANCLYLHGLCVKLSYRNKGIGRKLAERILTLNTYSRIYLIAVLMTGGFWRQLGFRHVMQIEYGDAPAEYMLLEL